MIGSVHIGTSGWHDDHWREAFYPDKLPKARRFDFYAKHFDAVEINNTFYRLPTQRALDVWCFSDNGEKAYAVRDAARLKAMIAATNRVQARRKGVTAIR